MTAISELPSQGDPAASLPKFGLLLAPTLVRQGDDIAPIVVRLFDAFNNTLSTWPDLVLDFSVDAPAQLGGVVHTTYGKGGLLSTRLQILGPVRLHAWFRHASSSRAVCFSIAISSLLMRRLAPQVGSTVGLHVLLSSPTLDALSGVTFSAALTVAPPCPSNSVPVDRDETGAGRSLESTLPAPRKSSHDRSP